MRRVRGSRKESSTRGKNDSMLNLDWLYFKRVKIILVLGFFR